MILAGETRITRRKSVPVPLCPPDSTWPDLGVNLGLLHDTHSITPAALKVIFKSAISILILENYPSIMTGKYKVDIA
jgi:hypothetical protein